MMGDGGGVQGRESRSTCDSSHWSGRTEWWRLLRARVGGVVLHTGHTAAAQVTTRLQDTGRDYHLGNIEDDKTESSKVGGILTWSGITNTTADRH